MTFGRVAGLENLAGPLLRLYHTHKICYGGIDEGWIEYNKAQEWFTDYIC